MDLDFSTLSGPFKKVVGHGGAGGTANIHAGSGRPTGHSASGVMVGQQQQPGSTTGAPSHLPHHEKKEVGHHEPSIYAAVPPVPPDPPQKYEAHAVHGAIDLVQEFMEVDGYTLSEAQELAKVAVQPRSTEAWMALTAELDVLIDHYCTAIGTTDEERAAIKAVRFRQSLASIPATIAWFRAELAMLEVEPPCPEQKHPLEPEQNFEGRDSAKAARMALHRPIKTASD